MTAVHRGALLAAAIGLVVASAAWAAGPQKPEGFPQRALTIVVPAGPGGGSDQLSRAIAQPLQELAEVGVQVVNKPGGGTITAIVDYMAMPADGYAILQHADPLISAYAGKQVAAHPTRDLTPVAITQMTFNQIYVRSDDERFPDWDSFLAYAKQAPGNAKIANVGNLASMEQINMRLLEKELGFTLQVISFDNPTERYAALLGGHVDAMFEQPGDVRHFVESGQFRPILTLLHQRPEMFADTPSLSDVGARFEPLNRFRGFWVHASAPEERVRYLEELFRQAYEAPAYQTFNQKNYMHLVRSYYGRKEAATMIEQALATYATAFRELGIIKD